MVRYTEWKDIFEWRWDQIALSFWKRYPNPESAHVLSEDVISREVRDGKLYTKRLLTKTSVPPKWAERLLSSRVVNILEESVIDAKGKTIVSYTRNIGYVKIMSAAEKVVYRADPEDDDVTVAERSAWVESKMFGLSRAIERFAVDRLRKKSRAAVNGFKHVINNMFPKPVRQPGEHSSNSKDILMDAEKKASHLARASVQVRPVCPVKIDDQTINNHG